MPKSRLSAVTYLFLVFASGILVGAVSTRLYTASAVSADATPPRTMAQYRKEFFAAMRQKVGATDAQIAQINGILDDAKGKLDELHKKEKPLRDQIDQERVDGIRAVLDDKQRVAFDNWRAERARQHALKQQKTETK